MNRTALALALGLCSAHLLADDWPEWRGKGRLGVWNETGILDKFPKDGLAVEWRTPIHGGFAGPAVTGGRVFVTDFIRGLTTKGTQRLLCPHQKTGPTLRTHQSALH